MSEPLTITLPAAAISRPRRLPAGFPASPPSGCPSCRAPIEVADRIRKVHGSWLHDECARQAVAAMSPSSLWLMLAEHVAAAPSAFKASEIRTIVRAVIEIAERTYDDIEMGVWDPSAGTASSQGGRAS